MNLTRCFVAGAALAGIVALAFGGDKPAGAGGKPVVWLGQLLTGNAGAGQGLLGKPFVINNRGETAGAAPSGASMENSKDHAFLSAGGAMTDLGVLPGFEGGSWARLINDRGEVAGSSGKGDEDAVENAHAFLFKNGKLIDAGTLGGAFSRATAMNADGVIAGYSATASGAVHAFVYENGRMTDLGTLGGQTSTASAINAAGEVAGVSETATGETHLFVYEKGKMIDPGTCDGCKFFEVGGMNDAGEVAGVMSATEKMETSRIFIYKEGRIHDLGADGGSRCVVRGINRAGEIIGEFYVPGEKRSRAFAWFDGKFTDLTRLIKNETGRDCRAIQVNRGGQVLLEQDGVGRNEQRHYLYSNGGMTDLTALIGKTTGCHADWINGMNDAAQMICIGDTKQGEGGFLFNYPAAVRLAEHGN